MRNLLIFAGIIYFLYSSWAPSWGAGLATWILGIAALMFIGPAFAKANRSSGNNRYYSRDYYDQQHP